MPDFAAAEGYPRPAAAWGAMVVIWVMVTLAMLDRGIIALMVDPLKRDLALSDVEIGALQGLAFAILYSLGSIPFGYLGDRYSRRWVFFAGVSIWSAATALCGLATSYAQLFLARMGVGLGEASLGPSSYAMVPKLFAPRRQAVVIGVLAAASSVGGSISFVLGGFVIDWAQDVSPRVGLAAWQIVFLVAGLPGMALAFLVFLIPRTVDRPAPSRQGRTPLPGYGRWLRANAGYLSCLVLAVGFHAVVATGLVAWTPAFISRNFGLDAKTIGLTFGPLIGICGFAGGAGAGWLIDALHARDVRNAHIGYLIANNILIAALGIVAFLWIDGYGAFLLCLAGIMVLMPVTGVAMAHLQMVTPDLYRGRTTAVFMVGVSVSSMILGPVGVAFLTEEVFGGPQFVGLGLAAALTLFPALSLAASVGGLVPASRALENARRAGL